MKKIVKKVIITDRKDQILNKYLDEIRKFSLIDADQEVELAQRIKEGDREALIELVKANLRFVITVAKQYQSRGLDICDIINEANLGLIKVAEKFDETRGFKFISYAVYSIRQSILSALGDVGNVVRLPLNKIRMRSKLLKIREEFEKEYNYEPTIKELSQYSGFSELDIQEIICYGDFFL